MATIIQEHIAHAPGMNTAAASLAADLRAVTVEVRVEGHGSGSGVIWQSDGLIVTNSHVVRGEKAEVVLADGTVLAAGVVDRDEERDLAALRVEAKELSAADIGDSSALRVGQLALAMGHPLGIKGALSVGIVHMIASSEAKNSDQRWIRADLALAPGNSGGPMVDAYGRVIGINSMVAGGLALAVPSNTVQRFIAGQMKPAFLGVQTLAVRLGADFSARLGSGQETGLMVLSVVEGGPAARNGLLPGDILIAAGATDLVDQDAFIGVLRGSAIGTPLPLKIIRGGTIKEVTAILGERETEAR
jgi:serine protease Do